MARTPQHRSKTPDVSDDEYQKIVAAFNIKTGTPFPPPRKHGKTRVFKRGFRHVRQ